jgi:hypothetical protein
MELTYEFTRSINESNGKRRVSEEACSGIADENGDIKLTEFIRHSYPLKNNCIREEPTDVSIKSQQANMKTIYGLVSQDLSYIHGTGEGEPSGAKKQFLTKSAAFLRALGNDMGFMEYKVTTNPGGIAVSGDVTLMGMWSEGNGLYLQISRSATRRQEFLYRVINHMKDYTGGANQWLSYSSFASGEYENLMGTLLALRKLAGTGVVRHAA